MDRDGAVAHGVFLLDAVLLADHDKCSGDVGVAGLALDELERGTHGVRRGVGRAAQKAVGLAHLDKHGAEIVALGKVLAAILRGHLALAELDHLRDHLVHALIGRRIDDLRALDIKTALCGRGLHILDDADQDRLQEAALQKPVGRLQDAGVGALGEHDGLLLSGFQSLNEFFKHIGISSCNILYISL